jgi:hypothetical protein
MSTLATIPAPSSNPIILPPAGDVNVVELEQRVRQIARTLRTTTMQLAWFGFRLRYALGDDWSPIGFDSEESYRESLGIGRSTWYKAIGIGAALCTLKLSDMEQITVSNAEILIQVDQSLWHDYPWIEEAKKLPTEQFALLVTQRNRQSGNFKEVWTFYRCKVPVTAKKFLEETVERFKVENGLSTAGEALELLIADVHDRPNVMTAMRRALNLIQWARYRVTKRSRIKDAMDIVWLKTAEELLKRSYIAVRMERSGGAFNAEDAKEVYPAESAEDGQEFARWSRGMSEQPGGARREESSNHAGVESPERVM